MDKRKIKMHVLLMCYEGFEILLDKIIHLYVLLYENYSNLVQDVCNDLESILSAMKTSDTQIFKILDRVVSWLGENILDEDFVSSYTMFGSNHGLQKLMKFLVGKGYFQFFLSFFEFMNCHVYHFGDEVYYKSWMRLQGECLSMVHEFSIANEQMIVRFVKFCSWENNYGLFGRLFENSSSFLMQIVLSHYDINKLIQNNITYLHTDHHSLVQIECGLNELCFGMLSHENKVFTESLYRSILDQIDIYLEANIPHDIIMLCLSYEFMLYYKFNQLVMEKWLRNMIIYRSSGIICDYVIFYHPNVHNKKDWLCLNDRWQINNPNKSSNLVLTYDNACENRVNYSCIISDFSSHQENFIIKHQESCLQLIPTVHDQLVVSNKRYMITDLIKCNLQKYIGHCIFEKHLSLDCRYDVGLKLKSQLILKTKELVKMGFIYLSSLDNIVVKEISSKAGDVEIFFIDFKDFKTLRTPVCNSNLDDLVNQYNEDVFNIIDYWFCCRPMI